MKLHSVGWFCVICREAVITLSGLYCSLHSEMKPGEEREVEAESGESQRMNGEKKHRTERNITFKSSICVSPLLEMRLSAWKQQHAKCLNRNISEVIGEESRKVRH